MLVEYDIDIVYRAGKKRYNVYSLSRCPDVNLNTLDEEKRQKIIHEMHDCPIGGYQGNTRILKRIQLYTTWPNLEQEVKEICQQNKQSIETKLN